MRGRSVPHANRGRSKTPQRFDKSSSGNGYISQGVSRPPTIENRGLSGRVGKIREDLRTNIQRGGRKVSLMNLQEEVADLLQKHAPKGFCDLCIAKLFVDASMAGVNRVARQLAKKREFSRSFAACDYCSAERQVTRFNRVVATGKMTLRSASRDAPIRLHVTRRLGADHPILHVELPMLTFELLADPQDLKALARDVLEMLD